MRDFLLRPGWTPIDKIAALVVAFVVMAWISVPSSHVIRVIDISVDGNRVTFVRELPLGAATARTTSEITLTGRNAFECRSGDWRMSYYQTAPGNTISYDIGDWAQPCLAEGPPFVLSTTRQVFLWGIIPLRQFTTRTLVEEHSHDG